MVFEYYKCVRDKNIGWLRLQDALSRVENEYAFLRVGCAFGMGFN